MNETPYKIAVGVLLLVTGIGRRVYGRHWWRAVKKTVNQTTGLTFLSLALLPGTVCLLLYLFSSHLDAFDVDLPFWLRLVGGAMFVVGDVLYVWVHRTLGRNWSPVLEIMEDHTLVTTGPYRYVRHPMYSASLVIFLGMSILAANWLIALTWLGGLIVLFAYRIPAEEALMIEEFGDQYEEYVSHTGRLFPILRRPH